MLSFRRLKWIFFVFILIIALEDVRGQPNNKTSTSTTKNNSISDNHQKKSASHHTHHHRSHTSSGKKGVPWYQGTYNQRLKAISIILLRIATVIFMIYIEEILLFIPFINLIYVPIIHVLRQQFFG